MAAGPARSGPRPAIQATSCTQTALANFQRESDQSTFSRWLACLADLGPSGLEGDEVARHRRHRVTRPFVARRGPDVRDPAKLGYFATLCREGPPYGFKSLRRRPAACGPTWGRRRRGATPAAEFASSADEDGACRLQTKAAAVSGPHLDAGPDRPRHDRPWTPSARPARP